VSVSLDENPDVNALWPQHFVITLRDGRRWERRIDTPIGHPDNPLSGERHLAKFRKCWSIGGMPDEQGEALIARVDSLEQCADVAQVAALLARR
jgi:2-methylcitrate dehydratase PrpD